MTTKEEYPNEDKLHRLINILPIQQYQQLSINLPLESWKYHALKAKIIEIMNIDYRYHAQEAINHGRGGGIFNMEKEGEGLSLIHI